MCKSVAKPHHFLEQMSSLIHEVGVYVFGAYILLLVSFSLLLHNDGQVLVTLFLELGHLDLGFLQLYRHSLHLHPRVTDLEEAITQFAHLLPQFPAFLLQQPGGNRTGSDCKWCGNRKKKKQDQMKNLFRRSLLLVSRHQLQVVGGRHIIISLQLRLHPLGDLHNRLVCGHKDTGNLRLDLQHHAAYVTSSSGYTFLMMYTLIWLLMLVSDPGSVQLIEI